MKDNWSPASWKKRPIAQQVRYPDAEALRDALERLIQLPPLVSSWEIETLKQQLAEAAQGKRFLLQGGDCSETFDDCRSSVIANKLKILLKMSLVLAYGSKKKVITVGRLAGQYAKPRSTETETRDGVTLPSYRGDLINYSGFTPEQRQPNPQLLLRGYERASLTLNFIRALVDGGFADFRHPELWDLDFVNHSVHSDVYRRMMTAIGDSVSFLETMVGVPICGFRQCEFFTSHEGLHLDYEQAKTRQVPRRTGWYNLTSHFLWIGDRTRALDGAHVEYFRGIANPIGVKIGPTATVENVLALADVLNPGNEPGRLTFIHRFGAGKIKRHLPALIEAVMRSGKTVLWCCDPMHGNTITANNSLKTRDFDDILSELKSAFSIHHKMGSILGGVHFELTGENVTECIGGARGLAEADLEKAYKSNIDPRLNYEQALEMSLLVAQNMSR